MNIVIAPKQARFLTYFFFVLFFSFVNILSLNIQSVSAVNPPDYTNTTNTAATVKKGSIQGDFGVIRKDKLAGTSDEIGLFQKNGIWR